MPLYKTITLNDGILALWELTDPVQELLDKFPQFNNEHFRAITSPRRQKEWLATRALLHHAGCIYDQLSYSPTGHPEIEHPEYKHISISHSNKIAGIILTKSTPTGIDIESVNRNFLRVERKYLSEEERLLAANIPDGHAVFWCIKEAVYKFLDYQDLIFDSDIKITIDENQRCKISSMAPRYCDFEYVLMKINDQIIVFLAEKNYESKIRLV